MFAKKKRSTKRYVKKPSFKRKTYKKATFKRANAVATSRFRRPTVPDPMNAIVLTAMREGKAPVEPPIAMMPVVEPKVELKTEAKIDLSKLKITEEDDDGDCDSVSSVTGQPSRPVLGASLEAARMLLRSTQGPGGSSKTYAFMQSTTLTMTSSGAGIVNTTVLNSVLGLTTDFPSWAVLFDEFFIVKCHAQWQPNSRYNYPGGATGSALTNASAPLGMACIYHGGASYTGLAEMSNDSTFKLQNTAVPFSYTWINNERYQGGVDYQVASATTPIQGWCQTGSPLYYQGFMQFMSPPGANLPVTTLLGVFIVHWHLRFRIRQ